MDAHKQNRGAFREGIEALLRTQHDLSHRPNHLQVECLVRELIKESGLEYDPRKEYFRKLAKSALLGRESMYNNFRSRRRK